MAIFKRKKRKLSKTQLNQISDLVSPTTNRAFSKNYSIGEYTFKVSINRLMALEAFKKNPEYWDIIQSDLSQQINNPNFNYFDFIKKDPTKVVDFLKMQEQTVIYSEKIVRYLLPQMLEFGKTDIGKNKNYKEYAENLLNYCEKNNVLYDWQDNDEDNIDENFTEEEAMEYLTSKYNKGIITLLMEFIQLGFTQGNTPSMPKIKITEM